MAQSVFASERWRSGWETSRPAIWNQVRIVHQEPSQDFALIADEHHAFGREVQAIRFHFRGRGGTHAALVPDQVHGASLAAWGIPEAHDAGSGEREIVLHAAGDAVGQYLVVAGHGLDAGGAGEIQRRSEEHTS